MFLPSETLHHNFCSKKIKPKHNNYKSFRPVSNLSFVSKLIEKCVYLQIQFYFKYNHLFYQFQSAYCIGHSYETALTHIHNDLLSGDCYDCKQHQSGLHNSLLMLLDLSAAFDTLNHNQLLFV